MRSPFAYEPFTLRALCCISSSKGHVGLFQWHFPLTFSLYELLRNLAYIHVLLRYQLIQHRKRYCHTGASFKASKTARVLGSAMRPDSKGSELRTVTHQNGFRSTITFSVPTFVSHLYIYLVIPNKTQKFLIFVYKKQ